MEGNKRNFSLSLWDHNDNFLCLLKSSNSDFEGQSFDEKLNQNISGEETLSFSLPMYVFNKQTLEFEKNERWTYIFNEQKIRYVEYDLFLNIPKITKEFVLKTFNESRNDEEKIIDCTCESLAVYELGKVGWGISFNENYVSKYELENNNSDLLTLDYWLEKIFYWETNLGRVSNTTECTKMLRGLQLRNDEGYPIASAYTTDSDGNYNFSIIDEPICNSVNDNNYKELENNTGWYWEVEALTKNNPDKVSSTTFLYEEPTIGRYFEVTKDNFIAQSLQKSKNGTISYQRHPIEDTSKFEYVVNIKKRLYNVERSNIFSIIQDLAEIFEVWPHFIYSYGNNGKITERKILFKTEAINDEIKFDFAYGKNLESCSRKADSNELITKLIVTDTESDANEGQILSIRQAAANPTGENYLYNFEYFYNLGSLSRLTNEEKLGRNPTDGKHSDEYEINLHCGKLKKINNQISNLQSYLVPLYNRKIELEGNLTVKEGEITGFMDNIQSLQDKIDAIPEDDRVIRSWSLDSSTYNHVGETRTFSTTTNPNDATDTSYYYVKFNRDDIIYGADGKTKSFNLQSLNDNNELISTTSYNVPSFIPRFFAYGSWHSDSVIEEENEQMFVLFKNNSTSGSGTYEVKITNVIPDISEFGDGFFVKGFYFKLPKKGTITNYARIRYKYCPLAYYYLLISDYWKKIKQAKDERSIINKDLQEINNRIVTQELELNNLLNSKKRLILQFERKYKPYIREGFWEPSDYQAQIDTAVLDTDHKSSIYEGLVTVETPLNELKLNNSLHNYTYYINLGNAADIDINSIEMTTIGSSGNYVPRYKGNDFELFRNNKETNPELIIGISPSLVDTYNLYNYNEYEDNKYKSKLIYKKINPEETINAIYDWKLISPSESDYIVQDRYIYLTNDNIITNGISVYGYEANSKTTELKLYTDFDYSFDYSAYTPTGERVPLNEQESYSTDIYYDYYTKITLKQTNLNNRLSRYGVKYTKETTLDYLMNDAIATSKKYSEPQVTYDISVVDLSSLNGYEYYKPTLGQKVPIWDIEMGLNGYEGFITSISKDLEKPENTTIEIATYKTKFEDIFQKLTATMTNVRYNENSLYTAADSFNTDGTIKTEVFRKALEDNLNRVTIGVNNDINISEKDGIVLTDRDTGRVVKLIGNGVFISEDGQNWKTGITGEGINTDALITGTIDTKKITIWNESEEQYRFMWTDQGLFAYGDKYSLDNPTNSTTTAVNTTSLSTPKDIIDYNKYVKFNQNGLDFNDGGKSALSLSWGGLRINSQNNSLNLDADNGLVVQEWNGTTATTRLKLGKLDNGSLYGLKLYGTDGKVTFQSDSKGDLWLQRHIRVGGSINSNNVVNNANAGIYGSKDTETPTEMQMGIRRDQDGKVIWDSTPIRFWAGLQTTTDYIKNIHVTNNDLESVSESTKFKQLVNEQSPSLAKFKVSAKGDILASGIDVGGWVGQGDKLRSNNSEAILRSSGYDSGNNNYPLIAIGRPTPATGNTDTGSDYNFRVYQDGSINIGSGQFTVSSDGAVVANNMVINGGKSNISDGSIGGLNITSGGLEVTKTVGGIKYKTALYAVAGTTDCAFQIGPEDDPNFSITGFGSVKANNITITGKNNVDENVIYVGNGVFAVDKNGNLKASAANISGTITATAGQIGDFHIGKNTINEKVNSLFTGTKGKISNTTTGVYLGDDGISIGSGFIATSTGKVTMSDATITGSGSGDFINAGNGAFKVTKAGNVEFKGDISCYYNGTKYTGVKDQQIVASAKIDGVTYSFRVINGLIVSRRLS